MEELKEWNYKVGIKLNIELRKKYTIFSMVKWAKYSVSHMDLVDFDCLLRRG